MTLEQMEKDIDSYSNMYFEMKAMYYFGIYENTNGKNKHYIVNLCINKKVVKKLIKHYRKDTKNNNFLCFLTDIYPSSELIPYQIFNAETIDFRMFNCPKDD